MLKSLYGLLIKLFFGLSFQHPICTRYSVIYSYQKDKDINFKGTFLTTTYDYFIDNELVCSRGSKANFQIRNFLLNENAEILTLHLKLPICEQLLYLKTIKLFSVSVAK